MHEGKPDDDREGPGPIYNARTSQRSDGGLRGEWLDAAEQIAEVEGWIALWLAHPRSQGSAVRDGSDHLEPAFLYLGDRVSLAFIAETAEGIAKHGEAFGFWAREMASGPAALEAFERVFLGHWPSATEFAQHVLDSQQDIGDSTGCDDDDSREDAEMNAESWARDLQRRGEIRVVPSPMGGVWVFRGW